MLFLSKQIKTLAIASNQEVALIIWATKYNFTSNRFSEEHF